MRCVTWSRDSHGLFDYESRYIAKRNIKTYTGGKIIRVNNDVEFISRHSSASDFGPDAKPLIIVSEKNGKFFVENDTLTNNLQQVMEDEGKQLDEDVNNKMFIVDYCLKKGDIIKLGRIKFKVKDFRTDTASSNYDHQRKASCSPVKQTNRFGTIHEDDYWIGGDDFSEEAIEIDCGVVDATKSEIQCKVCWTNEQTPQNPLLNSCKCDGSVRFIHYECLKYWLKQKMNKKEEGGVISYSWKQFECEICKKPYPYVFRSNGRKYRLVDVDVPEEKNFIWLESLTFEKNSSRMVHLVMPNSDKSSFKLGRGHESDVRVSDISVSRTHAILKYENDHQFYLEDNLSKFGTLVLAKQAIELDLEQTKAVQIGRSVISFTVKPFLNEQPQVLKTPSPMRTQQKATVEEMLKQKIEETHQRINKLMSSAIQQNPVFQQEVLIDDYPLETQNNFQRQDTSHQIHNSNHQNQDQNLRIEEQNSQQERNSLNTTLQRFEKMIQSVEQRLAEREGRYQNMIRPSQSSQSPERQERPTSHLISQHYQIQPSVNDRYDEDGQRNHTYNYEQNPKNDFRYRQTQSNMNIQNPEHSSHLPHNPLLSQNTHKTLSHVKQQSREFKYGRVNRHEDSKEYLSDYKNQFELSQQNFDQEIPLRIKNDSDTVGPSQGDNDRIDLSNYIQTSQQVQSKDTSKRSSYNMMNGYKNMFQIGQAFNNYMQENHLFNQIENQQDELNYRSPTPEKHYHEGTDSQTISSQNILSKVSKAQTNFRQQRDMVSPVKRTYYGFQNRHEDIKEQAFDSKKMTSQSPWRRRNDKFDQVYTGSQSNISNTRTMRGSQSNYGQNSKQTNSIGHSCSNGYDRIQKQAYSPAKPIGGSGIGAISPIKNQKTGYSRQGALSGTQQNSANRKKRGNTGGLTQQLYSRQTQEKPNMRF